MRIGVFGGHISLPSHSILRVSGKERRGTRKCDPLCPSLLLVRQAVFIIWCPFFYLLTLIGFFFSVLAFFPPFLSFFIRFFELFISFFFILYFLFFLFVIPRSFCSFFLLFPCLSQSSPSSFFVPFFVPFPSIQAAQEDQRAQQRKDLAERVSASCVPVIYSLIMVMLFSYQLFVVSLFLTFPLFFILFRSFFLFFSLRLSVLHGS